MENERRIAWLTQELAEALGGQRRRALQLLSRILTAWLAGTVRGCLFAMRVNHAAHIHQRAMAGAQTAEEQLSMELGQERERAQTAEARSWEGQLHGMAKKNVRSFHL